MDQILRDYVMGKPLPKEQREAVRQAVYTVGLGGQRQQSKRQACQREMMALAEAVRDMTGLDITKPGRKRPLIMARQAVVWLLTEHGHSLPAIAAAGIGFADHTTALHAREAVRACPKLRALASSIEAGQSEAVRAALVHRSIQSKSTAAVRERKGVARRAEIVAAVQRGDATDREIGQRFGISGGRVAQIASAVLGNRSHHLKPERVDVILAYVRAGLTDREIARRMQIAHTTVYRHRKSAGLPANRKVAPPSCNLTNAQRRRAVALHKDGDGASFTDIAQLLNVTRSAVSGVIWRDRQKRAA